MVMLGQFYGFAADAIGEALIFIGVVLMISAAIFLWMYCRHVAAMESLAKDIKTLAEQATNRRDTTGSK